MLINVDGHTIDLKEVESISKVEFNTGYNEESSTDYITYQIVINYKSNKALIIKHYTVTQLTKLRNRLVKEWILLNHPIEESIKSIEFED